jgi:hypothetical protein
VATVVFDIEVAGLPWEEVDESTRGYLLARSRPEDRDGVCERTSLVPCLGKIIAIAMWAVEQDRGLLLLEGKPAPECDYERVGATRVLRNGESELLKRFWEKVLPADKPKPRLVTYCGRTYDGPMLTWRSAQLGIAPSRQLVGYRYDVSDHCDLADALTFHGTTRDTYSLDYWCRRFDIESPKGSIDGTQVARAYRDGRIEDIGEYCLRDVRATAALYKKLDATMLPLFRRGS